MSIAVNLYYTGENGNAHKFAEEMEHSGTADLIRQESGNERYLADSNGVPASDLQFIRQ